MKKYFIFIILISVLFLNSYSKEITVGWESWEPYQYEDKNGQLTGFDVEVVREACLSVGYDVKFIKAFWKRILKEIEYGTIDIALSATKTAEREEYARFSNPYRVERVVLFVRKGDSEKYKIKKLFDLGNYGFTLGYVKGTYYGEEFEKFINNGKIEIQDVITDDNNMKKLISGRIDGFVAEDPGVMQVLDKESKEKIEIHPYNIRNTELHFMLSKKSTSDDDIKKINEGLEIIKKNGIYDEIEKKYFE